MSETIVDMSKTTRNLMAKIERRLDAYVDKQMTHCGHEPGQTKAIDAGERLLEFITQEIESLVQKAGLP